MEIALADQHVFVLDERLTADEIRQKAMDRRTGAFGTGLGNLLQRPKAEDIELVASQRRLEPFWHVSGRASYQSQHFEKEATAQETLITWNG